MLPWSVIPSGPYARTLTRLALIRVKLPGADTAFRMDAHSYAGMPLVKRFPSLALALLFAASGSAAQTTYKSTMPDGKVIYGEKPEAGAKRVETIAPPPAKTGTTLLTPAEKKGVDQRLEKRAASAEAQRRELEAAYVQLKKAETARDAGKEPLPGERLGTATGASRLTDEYWQRQKGLEAAVEAARERVKRAEQAGR